MPHPRALITICLLTFLAVSPLPAAHAQDVTFDGLYSRLDLGWDSGWLPGGGTTPGASILQVRLAYAAAANANAHVDGNFDFTLDQLSPADASGNWGYNFGAEVFMKIAFNLSFTIPNPLPFGDDFTFGPFIINVPYVPNIDLLTSKSTSFDSYLLDTTSTLGGITPPVSVYDLDLTDIILGGLDVPNWVKAIIQLNAGVSLNVAIETQASLGCDNISLSDGTVFTGEGQTQTVAALPPLYTAQARYNENFNWSLTLHNSPAVFIEILGQRWSLNLVDIPWQVLHGPLDMSFNQDLLSKPVIFPEGEGEAEGEGTIEGEDTDPDPFVSDIALLWTDDIPVSFISANIIFSEAVTGFRADHIELWSPENFPVTEVSVLDISGSGASYLVFFALPSCCVPAFRLGIRDDDSIRDSANQPLGGPGLGNGDFLQPLNAGFPGLCPPDFCGEGTLEGAEGEISEGWPEAELLEGAAEGEGLPAEGEGEEEGGPVEGEGTLEGEGTAEGEAEGEGAAEGEGEGTGEEEGEGSTGNQLHTADQNGDGRISLTELLRVIQLFNSGGFHCAVPKNSTEDGFVPGLIGDRNCTPHAADYAPQDWLISLSELLRVIQFYNSGAYHACPDAGTEDGFCPGLA